MDVSSPRVRIPRPPSGAALLLIGSVPLLVFLLAPTLIVTPMALTIRYKDGSSQLTPFLLDYERYNDPEHNAFFREPLAPPTIVV